MPRSRARSGMSSSSPAARHSRRVRLHARSRLGIPRGSSIVANTPSQATEPPHRVVMKRNPQRFGFSSRALAAGMVLAVAGLRPAWSDPADIFTTAAPLVDAGPPKAEPTPAGDSSVSANGSLQYSYAIDVPEGRRGMQPHLALNYSSEAPI